MSWHSQSIDDVLRHFSTSRAGLDDVEAQERLERHGPNRLQPPKSISALRILADQFTSVVVYLLLAATIISFALDDRVEAIAIAAVLVINTAIGSPPNSARDEPWRRCCSSTCRRRR